MTGRLQAVAEETLLILLEGRDDETAREKRKLLVTVRGQGAKAEMEFVSASDSAENLEDRIALLTTRVPGEGDLDSIDLESSMGRDTPLKLLRHYASSVSHRQYHDIEVIEVSVASPSV